MTFAMGFADQQPPGFKNSIERVAIVDVTSTIGRHFTETLLDTGKHSVTAITRTDSNSKLPDGVEVAQVDYNSEASLVEALKGQDLLVVTLSVRALPDTQTKLVTAAAKAGVEWIMPNEYSPPFAANEALGRDVGSYDHQVSVRKHIEDLGLPGIGLQCSYQYEFSLAGSPTRYGFDFAKKEVTFFDDGHAKINTTTYEQCGRAVAAFLSLPIMPKDESDQGLTMSKWRNKALPISSFLLSQRDMLATVVKVTGDKEENWTIKSVPSDQRFKQAQRDMKAGSMDAYVTAMYTRTFYPDGCGNFEQDGILANDLLGLPKEDLEKCTANAVRMAATGEANYKLATEAH